MPNEPSMAELVNGLIESKAPLPSLRIGATGHRALDGRAKALLAAELEGLFLDLADDHSAAGQLTAVSSLAAGADQMFLDVALRHGVPIEVVIPFANFPDDFSEEAERDSYERLVSSAASSTRLPWRDRSDGAYLAGGLWVVDHCDVLVAIWNGEKAAGVGGTGDVVAYCRSAGKPCLHLHSSTIRARVL